MKKEGKKKVCQIENSKGQPRQKLRQKTSTRLKTCKGGLGKKLGEKTMFHGKNSQRDIIGKNYMAEKEKKKKKNSDDNKQR